MKNNKGFSLVELIIVIALISILTGVSFVGLGYLYNTNVKSTVQKLDSSLQKVQSYTTAKSSGGRDIGLVIKKNGDGFYVEYKGIAGQQDEKIGGTNLTFNYYVGGSAVAIDSTHPLEINFDRSTGGLLPLTNNGSDYCEKIEVSLNGANKCTITISKVTGRTEISFFN